MLEGGRNLLLESAQEATSMSVATPALPRQCNGLPENHPEIELQPHIHGAFLRAGPDSGMAERNGGAGDGEISSWRGLRWRCLYTVADGTPCMDHLWTPWRYAYVTSPDLAERAGVPKSLAAWPGDLGCVFCNLIASVDHAVSAGTSEERTSDKRRDHVAYQ